MRILTSEAREKMRQGGLNRAKQFTSEYQKQTRSQLPREVCIKGGKTAYQKLVTKYGSEYAQDKAAKWRLTHPSSLEVKVEKWLRGIEHEREVKIKESNIFYYVDFLIGKIVVEVNGEWVHVLRTDKDNHKYKTLASWGYTVIVLPERDIESGKAKNIIDKLFRSEL